MTYEMSDATGAECTMIEQSSGPSAITGHITVDGKQVQQFDIPATGRVPGKYDAW